MPWIHSGWDGCSGIGHAAPLGSRAVIWALAIANLEVYDMRLAECFVTWWLVPSVPAADPLTLLL